MPSNLKKKRPDTIQNSASCPALLLAWYDRHRRRLPWRALAGEPPDPYRVWLSEIMLQQTTVKTVGPYFEKFLARWPDVAALGRASQDDVLRMWAGLGYYSRARNLHACAVAVLRDHGGRFPDNEEGLRALPGIGPYTASAIAAIAFDRRTMPVDGNIERVVSRLYAVEEPLPQAKPKIQQLAATLLVETGDMQTRAGDTTTTRSPPSRMRSPAVSDCNGSLIRLNSVRAATPSLGAWPMTASTSASCSRAATSPPTIPLLSRW